MLTRWLHLPAAAPPMRFADFAYWQRERLSGQRLERLTGIIPLALPTDRPRPAFWHGAGDVARFVAVDLASQD